MKIPLTPERILSIGILISMEKYVKDLFEEAQDKRKFNKMQIKTIDSFILVFCSGLDKAMNSLGIDKKLKKYRKLLQKK